MHLCDLYKLCSASVLHFLSSEAMAVLCFDYLPCKYWAIFIGFNEGLDLIKVSGKNPCQYQWDWYLMSTATVTVCMQGGVCVCKLHRSWLFLKFSLATGRSCLKARWRNSIVACLWTFRLHGEKEKKFIMWLELVQKWLHFYLPRQCGKQVTWLELKVPLICSCGWESACGLYVLDQIRCTLLSAPVLSLFAEKHHFLD